MSAVGMVKRYFQQWWKQRMRWLKPPALPLWVEKIGSGRDGDRPGMSPRCKPQ